MPNKNSMTLAGHLGQDPDLKYTQNGTAVCSFSVAESYGKDDARTTTWIRVKCWKELAEEVSNSFAKGDAIHCVGPMRPEKWTDKEGNERETWVLTAWEVSKPIYRKVVPMSKRGPEQQRQPATVDDGDIPF